MKRVIIVHRWDGNPLADWYQSVADSLTKKGFQVEIPEMPNTAEPEINAWVSHLQKIIGKLIEKKGFFSFALPKYSVITLPFSFLLL